MRSFQGKYYLGKHDKMIIFLVKCDQSGTSHCRQAMGYVRADFISVRLRNVRKITSPFAKVRQVGQVRHVRLVRLV